MKNFPPGLHFANGSHSTPAIFAEIKSNGMGEIKGFFKNVSVHKVGNKYLEEDLIISKSPLKISNETEENILNHYFLKSFKENEKYHFHSPSNNLGLNPVYFYVKEIFQHPDSLHTQSVKLAQHLYEVSKHPNIKGGDFFVAYFPAFQEEDESTAAIGLFKSENKDTFFNLKKNEDAFVMEFDQGVNPEKLDKGCLILNAAPEDGFRVKVLDKTNKENARFWLEDFLGLKILNDAWQLTSETMKATSKFVNQQLPQDYEIEKTEQIDLLNKTVKYFKEKEIYNEDEFAREVFGDATVADAFRNFRRDYQSQHELDLKAAFGISENAVKQKTKIFKSVLKLDKNFHVYIHGDRSLIERGTDENGRKFYKIYYDQEQ